MSLLPSLPAGFGDEGFEVGNCGRSLLERIENFVDVVGDIFKVRTVSDDDVFVLVHVGGNFDGADPQASIEDVRCVGFGFECLVPK